MDGYQVDGLIFDFDGVLVDTAEDIASAANRVLQQFGMPAVPVAIVRSYIGGGADTLIRRLLPEAPEDQRREATALFKTTYSECYDVHSSLYPGVRDVLEHFLTAGRRMAIATNKVERLTEGLVRKLGLHRYIELVVGPESVARRKLDPEAVELILAAWRVGPERTLLIGDTADDIHAGRAAGTLTVGALYGYGTEREIRAARPDQVIRSIRELMGLIS
jgi:2-phosphoglycolate phosphatase